MFGFGICSNKILPPPPANDASTINFSSISAFNCTKKCWKVDSARQTPTNIPSCLSIVLVIVLPGVLALDRRVRDVEKRLEYQHSGGHIVAELRYLISCVP